jgi:hypothetical protein
MVATEKPVASHCRVNGGIRKPAEDLFADHGRQTRFDDAPGWAFMESLEHLGSG